MSSLPDDWARPFAEAIIEACDIGPGPAGFLSKREFIAIRYGERLRFLKAVERVAPKVLSRGLAGKPRDAYQQIVDRAFRETEAANVRIMRYNKKRGGFLTPAATQTVRVPQISGGRYEVSDDPLLQTFAALLGTWAIRYKLNEEWILDAACETIDTWSQSGPQPHWTYHPPTWLLSIMVATEIAFPPPTTWRVPKETLDEFEKRVNQERSRLLRENGVIRRIVKQPGKNWHYEALARSLIDDEQDSELAKRYSTDYQTVQSGIKSAAALIDIPLPR